LEREISFYLRVLKQMSHPHEQLWTFTNSLVHQNSDIEYTRENKKKGIEKIVVNAET